MQPSHLAGSVSKAAASAAEVLGEGVQVSTAARELGGDESGAAGAAWLQICANIRGAFMGKVLRNAACVITLGLILYLGIGVFVALFSAATSDCLPCSLLHGLVWPVWLAGNLANS